MSRSISVLLAIILAAIAALHVYWGLGGLWPGHDEASLVDMVIGAPPGTPIPPFWACLLVVACVVVPALSALVLSRTIPDFLPHSLNWAWHAALWGAAAVFLLRGLSTYFSPLVQSAKGTAFFELDRMIYAPLCLFLGFGLLFVWFSRTRQSSGAKTS